MISLILSLGALTIWIYPLAARGGFGQDRGRGSKIIPPMIGPMSSRKFRPITRLTVWEITGGVATRRPPLAVG
jgi:hypothetical protein